MEKSHFDILQYHKKDNTIVRFEKHHDEVPECPYENPEEWEYFTLLIGVHSTCEYKWGEGNTNIYYS